MDKETMRWVNRLTEKAKERVREAKEKYVREGYTVISHHPDDRFVKLAKNISNDPTNTTNRSLLKIVHIPMAGAERVSVYTEKELFALLEVFMNGEAHET